MLHRLLKIKAVICMVVVMQVHAALQERTEQNKVGIGFDKGIPLAYEATAFSLGLLTGVGLQVASLRMACHGATPLECAKSLCTLYMFSWVTGTVAGGLLSGVQLGKVDDLQGHPDGARVARMVLTKMGYDVTNWKKKKRGDYIAAYISVYKGWAQDKLDPQAVRQAYNNELYTSLMKRDFIAGATIGFLGGPISAELLMAAVQKSVGISLI
jgi:hypothetical protein